MTTQDTLFAMQLFLTFGNCCIMLFAFKTFLTKPHTTMEEQLKDLEKRIDVIDLVLKDIQKSLDSSHEKHRQQKDTNEVFITSMLAFIDFEIAFCLQEGPSFDKNSWRNFQKSLSFGNLV